MGRLVCLVTLFALGSIASAQDPDKQDPGKQDSVKQAPAKPAETVKPDAQKPVVEYIGEAWMEDDGTIVMELHRTGDGNFVSAPPFRYPKSDPQYRKILDHLGAMRPGEHRLVKPFPD